MADEKSPENSGSNAGNSGNSSIDTNDTLNRYLGRLKRTDEFENLPWTLAGQPNQVKSLDPRGFLSFFYNNVLVYTRNADYQSLIAEAKRDLPMVLHDFTTATGAGNVYPSQFFDVFINTSNQISRLTFPKYALPKEFFEEIHTKNPNQKKCRDNCKQKSSIKKFGPKCKEAAHDGIEEFYDCFYERLTKCERNRLAGRWTKIATYIEEKTSASSSIEFTKENVEELSNQAASASGNGIFSVSALKNAKAKLDLLEPLLTSGIALPLKSAENITPTVTCSQLVETTVNGTTRRAKSYHVRQNRDSRGRDKRNLPNEPTFSLATSYCENLRTYLEKHGDLNKLPGAVAARTLDLDSDGTFKYYDNTAYGYVVQDRDEVIQMQYEECVVTALKECHCDDCELEPYGSKEHNKTQKEDPPKPSCNNNPPVDNTPSETDGLFTDFTVKNIVEIVNEGSRTYRSISPIEPVTENSVNFNFKGLQHLTVAPFEVSIKTPRYLDFSALEDDPRFKKRFNPLVEGNLAPTRRFVTYETTTVIFLFGRDEFASIKEIYLNEHLLYKQSKDLDEDLNPISNQINVSYASLSNVGITIPEEVQKESFRIEWRLDGYRNLPFNGSIVGYRDTGAMLLRDINKNLLIDGNILTVVAINKLNHTTHTSYIDLKNSDNVFNIDTITGTHPNDVINPNNTRPKPDDDKNGGGGSYSIDDSREDQNTDPCYEGDPTAPPVNLGSTPPTLQWDNDNSTIKSQYPNAATKDSIIIEPDPNLINNPPKFNYTQPDLTDKLEAGVNSYFYNTSNLNQKNMIRINVPSYDYFPDSNTAVPQIEEVLLTINDKKLLMKFSDRSTFGCHVNNDVVIPLGDPIGGAPCNSFDKTGLDNEFVVPNNDVFYSNLFNDIGAAQLTTDLGVTITTIYDLKRIHIEILTNTYHTQYVSYLDQGLVTPLKWGNTSTPYFTQVRDRIYLDYINDFTNTPAMGVTQASDLYKMSMLQILVMLAEVGDPFVLISNIQTSLANHGIGPGEDLYLNPTETQVRRYVYADSSFDITEVSNVNSYEELFTVSSPNWGTQQGLYNAIVNDPITYPIYTIDMELIRLLYSTLSRYIPVNDPYLGTPKYDQFNYTIFEIAANELAYYLYNYDANLVFFFEEISAEFGFDITPDMIGYNNVNPDCPPIALFSNYNSTYYPHSQTEQPVPAPQSDQGVVLLNDSPFEDTNNIGIYFSKIIEDTERIRGHMTQYGLPQFRGYKRTNIRLKNFREVNERVLNHINELGYYAENLNSLKNYLDVITIDGNQLHHSNGIFYQDNLLYKPYSGKVGYNLLYKKFDIPVNVTDPIILYFMIKPILDSERELILLVTNIGIIHYDPEYEFISYIHRVTIDPPTGHVSNYGFSTGKVSWITKFDDERAIKFTYDSVLQLLTTDLIFLSNTNILSQLYDEQRNLIRFIDSDHYEHVLSIDNNITPPLNMQDLLNHYLINFGTTIRKAVDNGINIVMKGSYAKGTYLNTIKNNTQLFGQTITNLNDIFINNDYLVDTAPVRNIDYDAHLSIDDNNAGSFNKLHLNYFSDVTELEEYTEVKNKDKDADSFNLETNTLILPTILSDNQANALATRANEVEKNKNTDTLSIELFGRDVLHYYDSVYTIKGLENKYATAKMAFNPYSISGSLNMFKVPNTYLNDMALKNGVGRHSDFDSYQEGDKSHYTELHVIDIPPITQKQQNFMINSADDRAFVTVVAETNNRSNLDDRGDIVFNALFINNVSAESEEFTDIVIEKTSKVGYCIEYNTNSYKDKRKNTVINDAYIIVKYPFTPTVDMFKAMTREQLIRSDLINTITVGYEIIRFLDFEILSNNRVKFKHLQFGYRNTFAFSFQNNYRIGLVSALASEESTRDVHYNEYRCSDAELAVILDETITSFPVDINILRSSEAVIIDRPNNMNRNEFRSHIGTAFKSPKMGYLPSAPSTFRVQGVFRHTQSKLRNQNTNTYYLDVDLNDTEDTSVYIQVRATSPYIRDPDIQFEGAEVELTAGSSNTFIVMYGINNFNIERVMFDNRNILDNTVSGLFDGNTGQFLSDLDDTYFLIAEVDAVTGEIGVPLIFFNYQNGAGDTVVSIFDRYKPKIEIVDQLQYYVGDFRKEIPVDENNV